MFRSRNEGAMQVSEAGTSYGAALSGVKERGRGRPAAPLESRGVLEYNRRLSVAAAQRDVARGPRRNIGEGRGRGGLDAVGDPETALDRGRRCFAPRDLDRTRDPAQPDRIRVLGTPLSREPERRVDSLHPELPEPARYSRAGRPGGCGR